MSTNSVASPAGPAGSFAAPITSVSRPVDAVMRFRGIGITETVSFPPAPQRQCWVYVTVNAEVALTMPQNPSLQALLHSQRARVSVDGQWIWWALRRKYADRPLEKMAGSDLIHELARHCATSGQRLLLLGSSASANASAVHRLQRRWPGLLVGGHAPRHFTPGEDSEHAALDESLEVIRNYRPDFVVLGLGPDKQYSFALDLASELDGSVKGLLCFGGAIDMASGQVKRAPLWWQRCGLEGIYRIFQQPSRLPRFLRLLPIVPIVAFKRY